MHFSFINERNSDFAICTYFYEYVIFEKIGYLRILSFVFGTAAEKQKGYLEIHCFIMKIGIHNIETCQIFYSGDEIQYSHYYSI